MKRLWRVGLFLFLIAVCGVILSPTVRAAGVVGTGSSASCESADLETALVGGGEVTFLCGDATHTINAGRYTIMEDTTIWGDNKIILTGENARQIFLVDSGATLTLHDVTLMDGEFSPGGCISVNTEGTLVTQYVTFRSCQDTSATLGGLGGGAIYNLGTYTAIDTNFESNQAMNEAGAIFNRGILTATRTIFEDNKAGNRSGAIGNDNDGVVNINDSAFIGNSAQGNGGAIGNFLSTPDTAGAFTVRRTLFVDNSSINSGGAIYNDSGNLSVENSTFIRNTSNMGGAISEDGAVVTIRFSTFHDNRADIGGAIARSLTGDISLGFSIVAASRNESDTESQPSCDGLATSLGYNLIDDLSCADGTTATDMIDTEPDLGDYMFNGGFTLTQLPNADSPALDKIPADQCLEHDQRLARRIAPCDIGAAELSGLFVSAYAPRIGR